MNFGLFVLDEYRFVHLSNYEPEVCIVLSIYSA